MHLSIVYFRFQNIVISTSIPEKLYRALISDFRFYCLFSYMMCEVGESISITIVPTQVQVCN